MPLRGAAYETLRNGVRPPNLCFLNARDQLYSESAVLLLLLRLCSGRRACGRKFLECRKHDTAGPVCSVTSMFLNLA